MSVRASRWWLFGIFVLTLPLPLLGPYAAYVPPVRLLILSFATASVAVVEGAAGPVPAIFLLFAIHALVYLVCLWGVAWFLARVLASISGSLRTAIVVGVWIGMLFVAITFKIYVTPFGRTPNGNLWSVLS